MKFHPISELTKEHQGKVVLACVSELADGKAFGRRWRSDESDEAGGYGTGDPAVLQGIFTHFLLLSEIEEAERADYIRRWGAPLTEAEEQIFCEKYGSKEHAARRNVQASEK